MLQNLIKQKDLLKSKSDMSNPTYRRASCWILRQLVTVSIGASGVHSLCDFSESMLLEGEVVLTIKKKQHSFHL